MRLTLAHTKALPSLDLRAFLTCHQVDQVPGTPDFHGRLKEKAMLCFSRIKNIRNS